MELTEGMAAPLTGNVDPRPYDKSRRYSLIPSLPNDPRRMEYLSFFELKTDIAGYPKPPKPKASSTSGCAPASDQTHLEEM